ncbi:DUF4292 domain-containing protein [Echinicola strongylocentroti]|uniref:DUF4292 domain-containing protein n=1 Tax=Echinicola strongylocentroti TaxID=1795355 RepID=A0A2Z4IG06_9BACT|nr:DUF4292 domain-containing protein [Echinicola strongylocentroti]AWW29383.1 DUF4292 domain-containing protein [Echinicola strongylocentroti]
MNKHFLLSLFAAILLLAGCAKKTRVYSSDETMKEFTPSYFDYSYLSAKARVVMEEESGKTTRGTLNLRAKRDSVIWFSISPGLGIEAARGIITREDIKVMDRINNKDINLTFDQFQNTYGLKLSLDLFQNVLFANIPYGVSYRDRLIRVGKTFELTQRRDGITYESVVGVQHGKVNELTTSARFHKGKLSASYPEFEDLDGQPYAYKILLRILMENESSDLQSTVVNLEFNKVEIQDSPLSFPYNF